MGQKMIKSLLGWGLIFVAGFSLGQSLVLAEEWHVDLEKPRVAKFISRAPLEEFEGVTDAIDGYLYWEGDSLFANNEFYFEVLLNTLDTGIGLRNRHMREKYLETDRWPVASYRGQIDSVRVMDSAGVRVMKVRTRGKFAVHGVERPLTVQAKLVQVAPETFRVTAAFQIELPDFNIEIPRIMFFKLSKVIRIEVMFHLKQVDDDHD